MNRQVLFVCTGNYYRSRFAEEYFNHLAQKKGLKWRAFSAGLSQNMPSLNNPGSISVHTIEALRERGVKGSGLQRYPRPMEKADFARYDRIIAMSELEHRPMLEARYLAHCQMVEYFEVGDLPLEEPKDAMNKVAHHMEHMIKQLVAAPKPKISISALKHIISF